MDNHKGRTVLKSFLLKNYVDNRKRLYIHIGNTKTGTTSIQKHFSLFEDNPYINYVSTMQTLNHREYWFSLLHVLGGRKKGYDFSPSDYIDITKRMRYEILHSEKKTHLISFEGFVNAINFPKSKELLTEIRNCLKPIDVKIIYLIRNPNSYLPSKYNSEIKSKKKVPRFLDWAMNSPPNIIDQSLAYDLYSDVFGRKNVILKCYDSIPHNSGKLIKEFYSCMGVTLPNNFKLSDVVENTSISISQIEERRRNTIRNKVEPKNQDAFIFGNEEPNEKDWQKFIQRLKSANRNNKLLFNRLAQANLNPSLSIQRLFWLERKMNCY